MATAALVAALAVGLAWPRPVPAGRGAAGSPAGAPGSEHRPQPPLLIWVDSNDDVVIGNLATLTKRVLTQADADPAAPLVPFAGRVYWVKFSGGYVDGAFWPRTIEELNPATGKSTDISPGEFAFPSASGRRLYIALTDTALAELPGGAGRPAELTLPSGWYLPGGSGTAVANGLVVSSQDAQWPVHPAELAVWDPATGQVTRLGRAIGVIGAYTPPGAGYSLLAWMPSRCRFPACPITITNTVTLASHTLTSPLRDGFVLGGAFSPDGRQLATFASTSPEVSGQVAELAIADTATGAVRLVPRVRMIVGEDTDWVRWLPGGAQLATLAGLDFSAAYLVTAATLAVRGVSLTGPGQGINYSAELIPPRS